MWTEIGSLAFTIFNLSLLSWYWHNLCLLRVTVRFTSNFPQREINGVVNILKIVSPLQREHLLFSFCLGKLVVHWKKQENILWYQVTGGGGGEILKQTVRIMNTIYNMSLEILTVLQDAFRNVNSVSLILSATLPLWSSYELKWKTHSTKWLKNMVGWRWTRRCAKQKSAEK